MCVCAAGSVQASYAAGQPEGPLHCPPMGNGSTLVSAGDSVPSLHFRHLMCGAPAPVAPPAAWGLGGVLATGR